VIFTCPGKTCNSQTSKGPNPRNDDPGGAFQTIAEDSNIVTVMRSQWEHISAYNFFTDWNSDCQTYTPKYHMRSSSSTSIGGAVEHHRPILRQNQNWQHTESIVRWDLHTLMFKWMTKGPAMLVQTTISFTPVVSPRHCPNKDDFRHKFRCVQQLVMMMVTEPRLFSWESSNIMSLGFWFTQVSNRHGAIKR
jgi:hypothetical protein